MSKRIPTSRRPQLPTSEWLPFAPEQRGKTIRINHNSDSCSGDSKSLQLTRKQDGSVNAYCHRCGGTGFSFPYGGFDRARLDRPEEQDDPVVAHGYTLPSDATDSLEAWPEAPRAWIGKAGVTAEQVRSWEFRWSDEAGTLYLPVWQETSAFGPKLVGYVLRAFDPKKYLTLTNAKPEFWGLYRRRAGPSGKGSSIVLTEDVLSARKVAAVRDSVALLGVNLRPSALDFIVKEGYSEAIIFLDGDNSQVKGHARKLAKQLSFIPTKVVETGRDPKDYDEHSLRKLLDIWD